MRYVHVECLNDWRSQSANPQSFYRCDQCHYEYNVERTKWAAILESERVIRAVAAAVLLAATALGAALLGPLHAASHFFRLVAFDPYNAHHAGRHVAALWCWQLDALVSGLLAVAAFGVYVAVRDAYLAHRHMNQSWLVGLVTALATHDVRIYRVFFCFGGMAASRATVGAVESATKHLLTKWGTMILEVRRPH